ncbi:MAG: hypothetical protein E7356_03060 [Clostridiales bacterium]|nr:hypothetical protein [Clostridiales bacterium]
MSDNWKSVKAEYDARQSRILEAKDAIKSRYEIFLEETKKYNEVVENEKKELDSLGNEVVRVNVAEVIQELANICGIEKKELKVKFLISGYNPNFGIYHNTLKDCTAGMQQIKRGGDCGFVSVYVRWGERTLCTSSFPLNGNDIQSNGKELKKNVVIKEEDDSTYSIAFKNESIVIAKHEFGAIMGISDRFKCCVSRSWFDAVLGVLEKQSEHAQENVMGDE